jgi:hypothetical protein
MKVPFQKLLPTLALASYTNAWVLDPACDTLGSAFALNYIDTVG